MVRIIFFLVFAILCNVQDWGTKNFMSFILSFYPTPKQMPSNNFITIFSYHIITPIFIQIIWNCVTTIKESHHSFIFCNFFLSTPLQCILAAYCPAESRPSPKPQSIHKPKEYAKIFQSTESKTPKTSEPKWQEWLSSNFPSI